MLPITRPRPVDFARRFPRRAERAGEPGSIATDPNHAGLSTIRLFDSRSLSPWLGHRALCSAPRRKPGFAGSGLAFSAPPSRGFPPKNAALDVEEPAPRPFGCPEPTTHLPGDEHAECPLSHLAIPAMPSSARSDTSTTSATTNPSCGRTSRATRRCAAGGPRQPDLWFDQHVALAAL